MLNILQVIQPQWVYNLQGYNFTTVTNLRVGVEVDFTMAVDLKVASLAVPPKQDGKFELHTRLDTPGAPQVAQWDANKEQEIINSYQFITIWRVEGQSRNWWVLSHLKNILPENPKNKMGKKSSVLKKFGAGKCRWEKYNI